MLLDIGIVIVNWNTRDLLQRCLETVYDSQGNFTYSVVVVDNNSDDESAEMVAEYFSQATLIRNAENIGYPQANNNGLHRLGYHGAGHVDEDAPRYALLLNPDTELPPYALHHMIRFMDSRPDVGVAGPKLILKDGSLDKACRRGFPTPKVSFYHYAGLSKLFPKSERFARYNMSFADPDDELEVDSVVGAYMQVRKEAIDKAGLLDGIFFMYGEDLDWAYRIKEAGYKVWYHPKVIVKHVKRAASRQSPKAQFEFWRAMLLFYRKHFRATTPYPVHLMILSALLFKGGKGLWQEIQNPTAYA